MKLNDGDLEYCKNCDSPLKFSIIENELEFIKDEQYVEPQRTGTKPKLLELIVSWALYFPILIGCVYMVYHQFLELKNGYILDLVFFWIAILLSVMFIKLLYRITSDYYILPNVWDKDKND